MIIATFNETREDFLKKLHTIPDFECIFMEINEDELPAHLLVSEDGDFEEL